MGKAGVKRGRGEGEREVEGKGWECHNVQLLKREEGESVLVFMIPGQFQSQLCDWIQAPPLEITQRQQMRSFVAHRSMHMMGFTKLEKKKRN